MEVTRQPTSLSRRLSQRTSRVATDRAKNDLAMRRKREEPTTLPLPNTDALEKQILTELVLNTNMIQDARTILREEYFHDPKRAEMYGVICAMEERGDYIDYVTIGEKIGIEYVTEEFIIKGVVDATATGMEIVKHCYILREGYIRRQAYLLGLRLMQQSARPEAETPEILALIDNFKEDMSEATENHTTVSVAQAMDALEDALVGHNKNVTSGFQLLDDLTYGGFDAGQLVILAARPSVGKTAVALYMALEAAKSGKQAHIYSIEMTKEELAKRYIFAEETISPYDMSKGTIDWKEFGRITEEYKQRGLYINDRVNTVDEIIGEIIRQRKREKLDIVYVDYLQLVRDISQVSDGKASIIGMVTSRFKELAKTLGIPIVLLSQLNRNSVMNGTKRAPMLADLRDSGAIEQDADIVLMLDPKTDMQTDFETGIPQREVSLLNMWVRKNRGGRRDVAIQLQTNATHTTYEQISLIMNE